MTNRTVASVTRLAVRDELDDLVAKLTGLRDEVESFAPDVRVDTALMVAIAAGISALSELGKPLPSPGPRCLCGHAAGDHLIRTSTLTVCELCGCAGWTTA